MQIKIVVHAQTFQRFPIFHTRQGATGQVGGESTNLVIGTQVLYCPNSYSLENISETITDYSSVLGLFWVQCWSLSSCRNLDDLVLYVVHHSFLRGIRCNTMQTAFKKIVQMGFFGYLSAKLALENPVGQNFASKFSMRAHKTMQETSPIENGFRTIYHIGYIYIFNFQLNYNYRLHTTLNGSTFLHSCQCYIKNA